MVQICCRVTTRRLLWKLKKFSKITEFEFQNSGPSFFASVSPVYRKKNSDSIRTITKLTEEIHFEVCHSGNLPPIIACSGSTGGVAACSGSWRHRCADPEMLHPHHSADSNHRSANWGHSELGSQSGRKNQRASLFVCSFVVHILCIMFIFARMTILSVRQLIRIHCTVCCYLCCCASVRYALHLVYLIA